MASVLKRPIGVAATMRLPARPVIARAAPQEPIAERSAGAAESSPPAIDLEAIRVEIDALRAQAVREGLAEGRKAAAEESRNAVEAEARRWHEGLAAVESALQQKLETLDVLAVEIGYEAVAAVLGAAYAKEAGIVGSVRRLIDAAAGSLRLSVQLAPSQLERVRAALGVQMVDPQRRLQFEADATLADDECRVASENGCLETSLALKLQAIQDALLQVHGRDTLTRKIA